MKQRKDSEFEGIVLAEIKTMDIKFGRDVFKNNEKK